MGYRNQNHAIVGPFQLSDVKIRDKWATSAAQLGSPLENPWSSPCSLRGTLQTAYQQRFERGYIAYCGTGQAAVTLYTPTFLPRILADQNTNNWNSTIYIRNLGSIPADVSVSFYKTTGKILDSRTYIDLPVNGTWEIGATAVVFDALVLGNSSFSGAAVVASDQGDVAVVVRTEKSNRVTAYTGISALNGQASATGWGEPGTTIYAPVVVWNPNW
jgi:hypothetical protein